MVIIVNLKKWRKHVRFRLMVQVNDGNVSTGSDERKEKFTLLYDAAITFLWKIHTLDWRWWNTSQIWKIGQIYVKSRQRVPIHLPFFSASSDCLFLFIVLVDFEWTLLSTVYGQLKRGSLLISLKWIKKKKQSNYQFTQQLPFECRVYVDG